MKEFNVQGAVKSESTHMEKDFDVTKLIRLVPLLKRKKLTNSLCILRNLQII